MNARQPDPRRELGAVILSACAAALELPNSAVRLRLISQLVEAHEHGALSRAELNRRLERMA